MSETLPYPEADAGGLMISRLHTHVGIAPALERAVLSATMAASSQSGRQEAAPLPPAKRGQNMRLGLKGKLDAL